MKDVAHPWGHLPANANKPAVVIADTGEVLTYGQMMRHADRCANLFASLGCQNGDTVALLSENNGTYAELCWAAKNSGLCYVCVSSQLNVEGATFIVENSDAKLLIASLMYSELAREIAQRLQGRVRVLVFGGAADISESYERLRDAQPEIRIQNARRGASMLYSSGTTGRPKGVRTPLSDVPPTTPPLRHRLLVDMFGFAADSVFINPGPFYHAAPLRMMMSLHRAGGTVIGFKKFDAEAVLRAIERYRATHGFFVPTMFTRMLRLPDSVRESIDITSMRCAIHGAAPCATHTKEAMMAWWGPVIYELYGGTEGCGHTFISPKEWLRKKGSVGKAAQGCTIRIVDEHHRSLPPNQIGLIYMSNGRRFDYYKDAAKTAAAHDEDGMATMGDIGYLDEDGYLFLTDRQANMIISGGVNIYPQEAEIVLSTHPEIADVAVIGVPHPEYGEEVKAVVQLRGRVDDPAALAADIIAYCRDRLSHYKCPRSVDFVAELPRNEAGKLLKRVVKERYWQSTKRVSRVCS